MKLKIEGAGQTFSVDLKEQNCLEWFRYFVELLLYPEQKPEEEPEQAETVEMEATQELSSVPAEKQGTQKQGYKGFLHIECPHCHAVKGFNSKLEMTYYKCNSCDHKSDLPPLIPLFVNCQCGKTFRYLTNRQEPMFDIDCLNCGTPVSVEYNAKKQCYETIGVTP